MKTGIELIAKERQEQIEKHGRTLAHDKEININGELLIAARRLIARSDGAYPTPPNGWDKTIWDKMLAKSHKDRLIIAGALIAAEIDRL